MGVEKIPNLGLDINIGSYLAQIMMWVGYFLISGTIIAVMFSLYYYLSFNYKVTVIRLCGGTDGRYSIDKPRTNRVKRIKNGLAWKAMFPLFNKKEQKPFPPNFIYPGRHIIAFEIDGEWMPGCLNINRDEGIMIGEINPVPTEYRNWQSIQHKKNAIEFAQHSWWEDNKYFVMVIATAAICLACVGATVYFTYKFVAPSTAEIGRLATAIKDFGTIQGIAPG